VVARAAKKLKVSAEAATLYLQVLALVAPIPKNVQAWNGWNAAALKRATAELVASELLLEAKRERAQRPYFLPGGWETLKAPHLPMESWKLSFYPYAAALGRYLATAPFHELFARAWQRIEEGDVPRYDEVKGGKQ
jgi:hypothetical protein